MQFIDLKSQQARIREDIEARISRVLDHGQYILGPEIKEMEEMLASYVGVKHCVGASSGTDTLLIAFLALGIGPGDEVITVPYTWISTAEMIALVGAKPVFVDIENDYFCLDVNKVAERITDKTRAIIAVNLFGHPAQLIELRRLADSKGIYLIEDNAQAPLAHENGSQTGTIGHIGVASLNYHKHIHTGEGGVCTTNDDNLAQD